MHNAQTFVTSLNNCQTFVKSPRLLTQNWFVALRNRIRPGKCVELGACTRVECSEHENRL